MGEEGIGEEGVTRERGVGGGPGVPGASTGGREGRGDLGFRIGEEGFERKEGPGVCTPPVLQTESNPVIAAVPTGSSSLSTILGLMRATSL